jgi:lipopolysaccharide cholinephosphotransferase
MTERRTWSSEEQFEACQAIGNYLLLAVTEILERHRAQYFLDAGTLLGAVNYQGWIPWDDDIDLLMPRREYEAVREALRRELPPGLRLSDPLLDADHYGPLPRVVYEDSHLGFRDRFGILLPERQKIVLDIYLLDHSAPAGIRRSVWLRLTRLLHALSSLRGTTARRIVHTDGSLTSRAGVMAGYAATRAIPLRLQKQWYWRLADAYNGHEADCCHILNHGRDGRNMVFPADLFTREDVVFEGRTYPAPRASAYLRQIYGRDFVVVPPAEQRIGHPYESFYARFNDSTWGRRSGEPD